MYNILPKHIDSMFIAKVNSAHPFYVLSLTEGIQTKSLVYKQRDRDIYEDVNELIYKGAYATAVLCLNEFATLDVTYVGSDTNVLKDNSESYIADFYKECENLLSENVEITEEVGKPFMKLDEEYYIYETESGFIRGFGKKKLRENFKVEEKLEEPEKEESKTEELTEDGEGVQSGDIAGKEDYIEPLIVKKLKESKVPNGFLLGADGNYYRGDYKLVCEGDTFTTIKVK